MKIRRFKPLVSLLLAGLLILTLLSPAAAAAGEGDRYTQVFDASQDTGKLTARYLKLTHESGEKTGDATVLTSPDGKIMLLDAGLPESARQVISALEAMGIEKIDYLVASHPHIDHMGGIAQTIQRFEIGTLYSSAVEYPTVYVESYLFEIKNRGIEHIILSQGDTFTFGEEVRAEVFHPQPDITYYEGYPDNSTQFINDLSLVLRLSWKGSSFLFGGDLYTSAERALAEKYGERLQSDVFKVGHHGAATSSSKAYREAIAPKIAVMINNRIDDIGIYNRYGKKNIDTYHTLLDGSVKISTAGDGEYEVLTQQDRATDFL